VGGLVAFRPRATAARGPILEAKAVGAQIISIDPQPAEGDVWLAGNAADVVPELVRAALGPGD
jgi:hypothetical protein